MAQLGIFMHNSMGQHHRLVVSIIILLLLNRDLGSGGISFGENRHL